MTYTALRMATTAVHVTGDTLALVGSMRCHLWRPTAAAARVEQNTAVFGHPWIVILDFDDLSPRKRERLAVASAIEMYMWERKGRRSFFKKSVSLLVAHAMIFATDRRQFRSETSDSGQMKSIARKKVGRVESQKVEEQRWGQLKSEKVSKFLALGGRDLSQTTRV